MQLDSDWNELISIVAQQRKIRTIDTIGQCGAPIHESGFQILHPGNGLQDLLITSGRFYAGGLLCESTPGSKLPVLSILLNNCVKVDDVSIDGEQLEPEQWVQLITNENPDGIIGKITQVTNNRVWLDQDISGLANDHNPFLRRLILYSDQPEFPKVPVFLAVPDQTDLIYLDVWERHITTIEDPQLREVALGGPDTDTRSKIIAQVKLLQDVGDVGCGDEIDKWNTLTKIQNGRLTTGLVEPEEPESPCELGKSGGYHGLENCLYRVEIHDSSNGTATFKWSRDNASHAYAIKEFFDEPGGKVFKISLNQKGKDEILKIKQQDWIEISGDDTDLDTENPGSLAKVLKVEGMVLTLDTDVSAHKNESFPKIRRWEVSNQRPDVITDIVPGTGFQIEDGIEIKFSGSDFRTGDYWVFAARTLTGKIEILADEPPLGVKHHYCKLALVTGLADGNVEIKDCRPEFSPLTELRPAKGGCCTVTVGENDEFQDIQLAIDYLNGGPGTVCIKPGVYLIDSPLRIKGNDISIKGCEGTALIINVSKEMEAGIIFQIQDSWDIIIHDLWCVSLAGARVVEVENSLFFSVYNCMLIGGGTSDLGGIVTCRGLIINSKIFDNLILGMIGIRYGGVVEQGLNLHINVRIERNIVFVLENGLLQDHDAGILGFDMVDNLMLGISLKLLSKAFFPETLFKVVEKEKIHDSQKLAEAKSARKTGVTFESLMQGDKDAAFSLNYHLKAESAEVKMEHNKIAGGTLNTGKPVVQLLDVLADANFTDNILIGKAGVYAEAVFESKIDNNVIIVGQQGMEIGNIEGLIVNDNIVISGTTAVKCNGQLAMNLTLENNRFASQVCGIAFSEAGERGFQVVLNIQISNNWLTARQIGIALNNPGILLRDFTAVDNTIINSENFGILINVFDENQFLPEDAKNFQRVIQRNSISVKGAGIKINVSNSKILDNDINIEHDPALKFNNSRGIMLLAGNAMIANNTIHGVVNVKDNRFSFGGIYLEVGIEFTSTKYHQTDIHNNKILGGRQNGIEIASGVDGLVIEENQIAGMGLNGIAVRDEVPMVSNLRIKGNRITDCHRLLGAEKWWQHAAIVLTRTRKVQISGNVICENGRQIAHKEIGVGGLYAEQIQEINISNNHFIDNGVENFSNSQAVILIPEMAGNSNSDIQIENNLIKGSYSPALKIGNFNCTKFNFGNIIFLFCIALDNKAIITGNHFESVIEGPSVLLNINRCLFTNNYVEGKGGDSSVDLGFGWYEKASGNVISAPITGSGSFQVISDNLEF